MSFFIDLLKLKTKLLFKSSGNEATVNQLKKEFKVFMADNVLRCVDVLALDMRNILVSIAI